MTGGAATPQDEARAARAGVALFARGDAGLVEVTGADRFAFLQNLVSRGHRER